MISLSSGLNDITIEFEDIAKDTSSVDRIFMRSKAHGKKTALIYTGETIEIDLCLDEEEVFLIKKIVYSTDGYPDQVDVYLNNRLVGQFTTHSGTNWGHLWNEFHFTGALGMAFNLASGQHKFQIYLRSADIYGVELDYVDFGFSKSSSAASVLCPNHDHTISVAQSNKVPVSVNLGTQKSFKRQPAPTMIRPSDIIAREMQKYEEQEATDINDDSLDDYIQLYSTSKTDNFLINRMLTFLEEGESKK
ncbi:hypothetical protein SNE40_019012 [Patella caerulea]